MPPPVARAPASLPWRPLSPRAAWWLGLLAAGLLGSVFTWQYLDRGWIPHDDGYLGHAAERVLRGELPHRDFTEVYTGGLTWLNALGLRLFGSDLLALRYLLFGAVLLWIPALYYLATRLTRPLAASAVTLLAVLWSVPNYPSNMPSWYNLFFATFGLAALLAYVDRRRPVWLVLAGAAGAVSVLFKISGMFFVGAGVLGLVYLVAREPIAETGEGRSRPAFRVMAGIPVLLAALALGAIGVARGEWVDLYQFTVPGMAITLLTGFAVLRTGRDAGARARRLMTVMGWYLAGVGVPLVIYALVYLAQGALGELLRGVFLLPSLRFSDVTGLPPSPLAAGATLALGGLVVAGFFVPERLLTLYYAVLVGLLALALSLVGAGYRTVHDRFFWDSLAQATPWLLVGLAVLIWRTRDDGGNAVPSTRWVMVGAAAALCYLIQYPSYGPVYFCYVAPLTLLVVVALLEQLPARNRPGLAALAGVYLVFGAFFLEPFRLAGLAGPLARQDLARLELPRGGLVMDRESAELYRESVELLRTHAGSGPIYALDAPELYFLSERDNALPTIFDFRGDSLFRRELPARLARRGVRAIAIRHGTPHSFLQSPPLGPELLAALERQFPMAREIRGNVARFTIRWDPGPSGPR